MSAATVARQTSDYAARIARLRRLAWALDARFGIPGTRFRFGLNSLLGLAPAVGDVLLGLVSLYIVWEARQLGAPTSVLGRMTVNILVEVVGGAVPLIGDAFDVVFKANLRNIALLDDWLKRPG